MKFEFNWPSGFRGEIVDEATTDGSRSDWYTISSSMSLPLRYAKMIEDY